MSELRTTEGGVRVDTHRAFVPQGCDHQGRQAPSISPAEACTELGSEAPYDGQAGIGVIAWSLYSLAVLALAALPLAYAMGWLP